MNKKVFTGLIVLMGISILGIIVVQLVWMNNAINVKNELFTRSVNEVLQKTVTRLERMHDFEVVNDMVFPDSVIFRSGAKHFNLKAPPAPQIVHFPESSMVAPHPVKIVKEIKPGNSKARIEIKVETGKNDSSESYTYSYNSGNTEERRLIVKNGNSRSQGGVIWVQSDSVLANVDSLYEISVGKIDSMLIHLDTFHIIQPDISKRARVKAAQLKNMASQVVTEIYEWDTRQMDHEKINGILEEELENASIPLEFQSAILQADKLEFLTAEADSAVVLNSPYQVKLYPGDIFQKNVKLAVYFPGRDRFIYHSLNWLLVASFLFSVFILTTFSLSIFYILRQKKISDMKSDFINNMTHEFKTPIATISVATDSITNEKVLADPERIRYFAGMIKKENNRMNRQVEDILTIARLDKKDFEFKWEAVNIHELIEDAIQGISIQVEKRKGEISHQLNASNPIATTDKIHFTNIIFNLLDNAIKYSADAPKIRIETVNKNSGILVTVEDSGIGMTKAVQSKIFERFYRQASGNIHNVKGFGLGLSYVRAVLEANRGLVAVQSEPGKGSKFTVFVPFVRE